MRNDNEIWLVEAKVPGGKYQVFCETIGCRSKEHAEELARIVKVQNRDLNWVCRIALYRRVGRRK